MRVQLNPNIHNGPLPHNANPVNRSPPDHAPQRFGYDSVTGHLLESHRRSCNNQRPAGNDVTTGEQRPSCAPDSFSQFRPLGTTVHPEFHAPFTLDVELIDEPEGHLDFLQVFARFRHTHANAQKQAFTDVPAFENAVDLVIDHIGAGKSFRIAAFSNPSTPATFRRTTQNRPAPVAISNQCAIALVPRKPETCGLRI